MIDHMSTYATDFMKTRAFYQAAFSPLGYDLQAEFTAKWNQEWPSQRLCAFGPAQKAVFWIIETRQNHTPRHVAFAAGSRASVDLFYMQALENGGGFDGLGFVFNGDGIAGKCLFKYR